MMNYCLLLVLLLVSGHLYAQTPEEMMAKLEKAQTCMHNVDRTEMKRLEAEFKTLQTDIKKLCDAGNSDQARQKAMAFAAEVEDSTTIDEVKECFEIVEDMMPELPILTVPDDFGETNICG